MQLSQQRPITSDQAAIERESINNKSTGPSTDFVEEREQRISINTQRTRQYYCR